ncbi:MAG: hypothetical protein ACOX9C_02960 [Kiritimatiellia bacterium]|jgi:hypothetical protein
MTEWNLRSRSHTCHQCSAAFVDGERCFTGVAPFEAEVVQTIFAEKIAAQEAEGKPAKAPDYVRIDFCPACWDARRPADWISLWNSLYTAPEPPAPEPLPRETAESLLRKLLEGDDLVENTSVIFVLAVILERKKILVERGVRREDDGSIIRVYEHRKSGEVMLIADPQLQPDQIPSVQQRIDILLAPPEPSP